MNNLKAVFPLHTIFKRDRPRATGGVKERQEGRQKLCECWLAGESSYSYKNKFHLNIISCYLN